MEKRLGSIAAIVFGVAFLGSLSVVLGGRLVQYHESRQILFTPRATLYTPPVPAAARKILVTDTEGWVIIEERSSDEEKQASASTILTQGGRVATKAQAKASLEISDVVHITLGEQSDLALINLIPRTLLFEQVQGSISYTTLADFPVSVRLQSWLVQVESGTIEIAMHTESDTAFVEPASGRVKIGFVNGLDETVVKELTDKQRARLDLKKKTIKIL